MPGPCAGDLGFPEKFPAPIKSLSIQNTCKFLANPRNPAQLHFVRGSPVLRFFILTLALAATGLGLMQVTSLEKLPKITHTPRHVLLPAQTALFRLILSSPASFVEIDTGKKFRPLVTDSVLTGSLEMDPKNPSVGLIIRWKNPATSGEHRFAKLIVEAPNRATFSHTFDAAGDLDDFIELPLPAAP